MNERWEYKIIYVGAERWTGTGLPSDLNEKFDEYGAQGWELVGTESIERPSLIPWGGSKTVGVIGFFKRRAPREGGPPTSTQQSTSAQSGARG